MKIGSLENAEKIFKFLYVNCEGNGTVYYEYSRFLEIIGDKFRALLICIDAIA